MPYYPRKSVDFYSFSVDNVSQDFTFPNSSIKSFTKATPFLNNESLNNVLESDVTINELFQRSGIKLPLYDQELYPHHC